MALPGYLEVLPGALAGSVCRPGRSGNPASTTGFQRRNNAAFRIDGEKWFVALMLRDIPPPPQRGRVPRRQRRTRDGVTGGRGPWLAALSCEGANHEESFKFGGRDGGCGVRSGGASWAFAQQAPESNRYGYGPYMMMMWSGWGYGMIFGPLFMIFVLVMAIAAAVVLVRELGGPWRGTQPRHQTPPARPPIDILKERYARGEIDKDEFEEPPGTRRLTSKRPHYGVGHEDSCSSSMTLFVGRSNPQRASPRPRHGEKGPPRRKSPCS